MANSNKVSEGQKDQVWDGMYTMEKYHRYFDYVESRYRFHNRLATFLSLIASSGVIISLITGAPGGIAGTGSGIVWLAVAWLLFENPQKAETLAKYACGKYKVLAREWEILWNSRETLSYEEVDWKLAELRKRWHEVTISIEDIPTNTSLSVKAERDARSHFRLSPPGKTT